MNSIAPFTVRRCRQGSTWTLLFLLLISQLFAVVHAADLGAHESEPCEICLVKNSSDDDFVLASDVGEYFEHFETFKVVSVFSASYRTSHNHLIRAPPL